MDNKKEFNFFWAVGMTAFATLATVTGVSLWWVLGKADFLLPIPFLWGGVGYGLRVTYLTLCTSTEEEVAERARGGRALRELREELKRLRAQGECE